MLSIFIFDSGARMVVVAIAGLSTVTSEDSFRLAALGEEGSAREKIFCNMIVEVLCDEEAESSDAGGDGNGEDMVNNLDRRLLSVDTSGRRKLLLAWVNMTWCSGVAQFKILSDICLNYCLRYRISAE